MPTRLALRVLALLLALGLVPMLAARAGGPATSEYLVNTVAPRWNMSCSFDGAISILFWAYFRFRPRRTQEPR